MAKKGLKAWVGENWVDIANKKSDGSYPKCGEVVKKKEQSILNVSLRLKQEPCQKVKKDLL